MTPKDVMNLHVFYDEMTSVDIMATILYSSVFLIPVLATTPSLHLSTDHCHLAMASGHDRSIDACTGECHHDWRSIEWYAQSLFYQALRGMARGV